MSSAPLRVALFSGNYNYVRDGANRALNTLVGYLLRQGAQVRVYSPTVARPAFAPTGDLVSLPSISIPGRAEYRIPLGLCPRVRRDLGRFNPDIVHISSPDPSAHRAVSWARARGVPVLASVHTHFETYFRYYNLSFLEPVATAILRRLYRRCDALVAPSESFAQVLRAQRMNYDISLWSRGIDHSLFNPNRRDLAWRRDLGIGDGEVVIGFLGRLVMEKGLDVFSETIDVLKRRSVPHRVLVVGDGPARGWFEDRLPGAVFVGFQANEALARAVASMDVLFNPSVTETFGNVTLEAMACAVPALGARATGSSTIIQDGRTGFLCEPGAVSAFADRLESYVRDPELRIRHAQASSLEAERYHWDPINEAVLDAYKRLIATSRKK
ncbi:glycosyl hydrolase [Sphingobium jiangsuense]|uniref:Glycosyltransferase involved in cell wall biosynthesis n=1 Tax=Sphingobium jiangsuense TaxID=870476 RepID=A0A7W6BLQ2_9SPHN|nr:glycosyltransferase family 1 protein [Sphingobium jiangsuense]MBB3928159.1 glycosyltransferase involved in cell wall biosynthesis [Sphingobium jiangsuense]GLT02092.1 glycosyl hydrolase [Sphingobium jiangsuense]